MGVAIDENTLSSDYKEVWGEYIYKLIEDDKSSRVYVYENNKTIEGFIIGALEEDNHKSFGVINDICVNESNRGDGIGSKLMDSIFEWFESQGIKSIYLESGINNHSAHMYFEKRGFKAISKVFKFE